MIGDLFRKRDTSSLASAGPTQTGSSGMIGMPQIKAPSCYSQENENTAGIPGNPSTFNLNHPLSSIPLSHLSREHGNTLSSNYEMNNIHRVPLPEGDTLTDQTNVNMPSLYGLSPDMKLPSPTFRLSDKLPCIRMVIVQDAGIRKKQPLFDSAVVFNKNFSAMQQKLNKKIHHSINELSLFMFGSFGMPISENNISTKIHYLPSLPGMPSSILITRLFSIDASFVLKPSQTCQDISDWHPTPLIRTNEMPQHENTSIRFSIGLVIPTSSSMESVRDEVTENWLEFSKSFLDIQNLIVIKLKNLHSIQQRIKLKPIQQVQVSVNSSVSCMDNSKLDKLNFQAYCLQSDPEVYQEFSSFIKSIVSLIEIPRLFIDIKHSNQSLIDWASTLSLWLELKDGRSHCYDNVDMIHTSMQETFTGSTPLNATNSIKFLAFLLSILLPLRNKLFSSPHKDATLYSTMRIVIGTANPVVSQKLILILAGLLGYEEYSGLYDESLDLKIDRKNRSRNGSIAVDSRPDPIPIPSGKTSDDASTGTPVCSVQTRNNSLVVDSLNMSIENSVKYPNSPSVSTFSANVQPQRISVPSLTRTSSYASLQNLSSSYNNSVGSQSSWRAGFGSFMDRWKSSVTPSPTTSQHSHASSMPSPNIVEYDEFPWSMNKKSTNLLSSSPAPSMMSEQTSFSKHTAKYKLSNTLHTNTYKAKGEYSISRSTNNLLGAKLNSLSLLVSDQINQIMRDEFECYLDACNESVVDVSMKNKDTCITTNGTVIPLPMLTGYVPQFMPKFSMLSCPNKYVQEQLFVPAMKNDLRRDNISNTTIFSVNLGMRRVNVLEMKAKDKFSRDESCKLYSTRSSSDSNCSTDGDTLKSKPKSNLTKSFHTEYELNQSTLFAPNKMSNADNIDFKKYINSLEKIDALDKILDRISLTIENFFDDLSLASDNSEEDGDDENTQKSRENECCERIRDSIEEIMCLFPVET